MRPFFAALLLCLACVLSACGGEETPTSAPATPAPAGTPRTPGTPGTVSTDNNPTTPGATVSGTDGVITPGTPPTATRPAPTATATPGIQPLPDRAEPTSTPILPTPALIVTGQQAGAAAGINRMYAATIGGLYSINPDTLGFTQLLGIDTPQRPGHMLALSPDKARLYVLDENVDRTSETTKAAVGVRYFDAQTTKLVKTFRYAYTHDGRNYSTIALNANGSQLFLIGFVRGGDTIVTIVNSADGAKVEEYTLPGNNLVTGNALYAYNAIVDEANKHLIIAYSAGGAGIFDLATHKEVTRLSTVRGSIILAPSGYLLAARGGDGDPLGVYDAKTGVLRGTITTNAAGKEVDLQYASDGTRLFTLTENCIVNNSIVVTPNVPGYRVPDSNRGFRDVNLASRVVKGQDAEVCGSRLVVDPAGNRVFAADKKLLQRVDLTYYGVQQTATLPSRIWDLLIVSK